MLKTYLVTHSHRFGTDLHKFATEREDLQALEGYYSGYDGGEEREDLQDVLQREPLLEVILDALEINFEPEREDTLIIDEDNMVAKYIA